MSEMTENDSCPCKDFICMKKKTLSSAAAVCSELPGWAGNHPSLSEWKRLRCWKKLELNMKCRNQ